MIACKSCGAEIVWCVTEQGKRMPIDAKPSDQGNVCMFECPETGTDMCRVISRDELATWSADEDGQMYTSHFATCPNAKRHRKGK
jgi:hypothetical protein